MLKGEAKTKYQRNYMRDRRAKLKLNRALVRPRTLNPVRLRPDIDADGNVIPDE